MRSTDGPLYLSSSLPYSAANQHYTLYYALVLLLDFPQASYSFSSFLYSLLPIPSSTQRYEVFDFFVYVVILAFCHAGFRVVLESEGALICIC
jgi:hypothetical protein